jgi:hypothetical protein
MVRRIFHIHQQTYRAVSYLHIRRSSPSTMSTVGVPAPDACAVRNAESAQNIRRGVELPLATRLASAPGKGRRNLWHALLGCHGASQQWRIARRSLERRDDSQCSDPLIRRRPRGVHVHSPSAAREQTRRLRRVVVERGGHGCWRGRAIAARRLGSLTSVAGGPPDAAGAAIARGIVRHRSTGGALAPPCGCSLISTQSLREGVSNPLCGGR